MADPLVWSKFPQHLLFCVIENTDHPPTLRSWSSTCKDFNAASNRELMRRHFTFSKKDVFNGYWEEGDVVPRVLQAPATLIERLSFDLQFDSSG